MSLQNLWQIIQIKEMKKETLLKYCEEKKIWVPKGAKLDTLVALIARHALHCQKLARKCFGLWDREDTNCLTCDHSGPCFKASFGMDKETYFKKVENADKMRPKD